MPWAKERSSGEGGVLPGGEPAVEAAAEAVGEDRGEFGDVAGQVAQFGAAAEDRGQLRLLSPSRRAGSVSSQRVTCRCVGGAGGRAGAASLSRASQA